MPRTWTALTITLCGLVGSACGPAPEDDGAVAEEQAADALTVNGLTYVSCSTLLARYGRTQSWLSQQVNQYFSSSQALAQVNLVDRSTQRWCWFRKTGTIVNTYPHSPYQSIGSITKTVTGTVLARYIREGRVTLGTTVASLLPELSIPSRCESAACVAPTPITLVQLATHASGLPNMPTIAGNPSQVVNEHAYTQADFEASLAECQRNHCAYSPAGTYSNYGYALLGLALRRVRGYSTYLEMVRAEVLVPLGMTHLSGIAYVPGEPGSEQPGACTAATPGCIAITTGNTVPPIDGSGRVASTAAARINIPAWSPLAPAGALWMMESEFAKYLSFTLGLWTPPELAGTQGWLFMPQSVGDLSSTFFGLGWNLDVADTQDIFKGGAVNPGYRSFVLMDWNRTLGVSVTTNVRGNTGADMEGLAYALRDMAP